MSFGQAATAEAKKKQTKAERREKRREYLRSVANHSKDPGLKELFNFLDAHLPYYVQHVNQDVYIPSEGRTRETDIIGKTAIIEVKMGRKGKVVKQLLRQKEVADKRGLKAIVYAPKMSFYTRREFEKRGIICVTSEYELLGKVKK